MRLQDIGAGLERVFYGNGSVQRTRLVLRFETILTQKGIQRALAFLNDRVSHRFTAVSRFDTPILRTLYMVDRGYPGVLLGGRNRPLSESYAAIVQRTGDTFITEDSLGDSRLGFHVARSTTVSYVGIPIQLPSGEIWGVLHHHDRRPRGIWTSEVLLLQELAPTIARWVKPSATLAV